MIHPVPAQTMSQLERKMTEARVAFDEQKVQAWRWRPVAAGGGWWLVVLEIFWRFHSDYGL